jgi:hypothetical protein
LTTVATLGFGDIPPLAFAEAYNFVSPSGWVAFNIKEAFLGHDDTSGFCRLVKQMIDSNILKLHTQQRYRHRLALSGDPLHYVALVGEKQSDIPTEMVA